MADTIEKIYCSDRDNDSALTAAILSGNNRRDDYNNWMNNPFAYSVNDSLTITITPPAA